MDNDLRYYLVTNAQQTLGPWGSSRDTGVYYRSMEWSDDEIPVIAVVLDKEGMVLDAYIMEMDLGEGYGIDELCRLRAVIDRMIEQWQESWSERTMAGGGGAQ